MIQHNSKNHDIMERLYSPDKMVGFIPVASKAHRVTAAWLQPLNDE